MSSYIPGYINSSDVLGFGSTTINAMFWQKMHSTLDVHEGVMCDGCQMSPLRGIRWKCQTCPDHDVCTQCKTGSEAAGHAFMQMSMTSTNNQHAMATGQGKIEPEAAVHWVPCKHCAVYPIRGQLFCCVVCKPDYNLCQSCNDTRRADPDSHPHRFDWFYMPRACNPPPNQVGGNTVQTVGSVVPTQAPTVQFQTPPPPQTTYQVPQSAAAPNQPIILVVQQDSTTPAAPYSPPAPLNHGWQPRYGSSDEYYHNTQHAMAGGLFGLTDHRHQPIAVAKHTYVAQADDELSFPQNGQVLVTEFCNKDWWRGEWNGLEGLFPCAYVELEQSENLAA